MTANNAAGTVESPDAIDERDDDLRLYAVALVRSCTDTGVRHDLSDIEAELGLQPPDDESGSRPRLASS